eukprot:3074048-Pleurochrysis_carterae.AAC.1
MDHCIAKRKGNLSHGRQYQNQRGLHFEPARPGCLLRRPSTALTKKDVETYLGSVDVRGPLEAALNAAVSFQTKEPMEFFTRHFAKLSQPAQSGLSAPAAAPTGPQLVDVSSLTQIAKDYLGLLPQPEKPTYRTALVQIYVRSAPYGGSD